MLSRKEKISESSSNLTPEISFLLKCINPSIIKGHQRIIDNQPLMETLDWHSIINNACYHKVTPLLYKTLTTYYKEDLPPHVLSPIAAYYRDNALNSLIISASLVNVIKILNGDKIEVLAVKGPILAEKLYGSIALRTYSDVDILVHKKDLLNALKLLLNNDYRLLPEGISISAFVKFLELNHHGRLVDSNGVLIELHWELSDFYVSEPLVFDKILPFLKKSTFNNVQILDLSDEMLFLFLCLHGSKHLWKRLDHICSICYLIQINQKLDWDQILFLCNKLRMTKRMILSTILVKKIFTMAFPAKIENLLLNAHDLDRLTDQIIDLEIIRRDYSLKRHPFRETIKYHFVTMDCKLDAVRFISRIAFVPDNQHQGFDPKLPDGYFWLYFLHKPFRILILPLLNKIHKLLSYLLIL